MAVGNVMWEALSRQPSYGNATEIQRLLDAHPYISFRLVVLYKIALIGADSITRKIKGRQY